MARKKEDLTFITPDAVGHDFEDDDYILNYKPVIEFVEPDIQPDDGDDFFEPEPPATLDSLRTRTANVIEGYKAIKKLTDLAQERIDQRVAAAGGLEMILDPNVDSHVIEALKRKFPDEDPTKITYDMYRNCLDAQRRNQPDLPVVTGEDIRAAKADPYRTDFGGLGNTGGQNRAEISSPANMVKPINISSFQTTVVKKLFEMLTPLISTLVLDLMNPF